MSRSPSVNGTAFGIGLDVDDHGNVIVVVEGPSAAGKTTWCLSHAECFVAEYVPTGDEPEGPMSVINNPQHDHTRSFLRRMQSEHHAVEHVPATLQEAVAATHQDLEEAE